MSPDRIAHEWSMLERAATNKPQPEPAQQSLLPHLVLPDRHEVKPTDIIARRLYGNFAAAAERGPADFAELLMVPGMGARTVRALAMVAEVMHGAPIASAIRRGFPMLMAARIGILFLSR